MKQFSFFTSCEINLKLASIQCTDQGLSERYAFVLCFTESKSLSFSSVVSTEDSSAYFSVTKRLCKINAIASSSKLYQSVADVRQNITV